MAKVFLSHSSKDKDFVRELYRRLTRDGVECFYDEESIEWGANWVLSLEQAIDRCEALILVLSPDFVASRWSQLERTAAMANDPAGLERKLLPLKLKDCLVPPFLQVLQALDVSTQAGFEQQYPKICRQLGGTVRPDPPEHLDRTRLPAVTDLPRGSVMPYRSLGERFIGRVDDLWQVYDRLRAGRTAIVQGLGLLVGTGGLGKTQLAIEYAHRYAWQYPGGIYWIEADQGLPRLIALLTEAARLDLDGRAPLKDQVRAVWSALNQPLASLVVLDNFPAAEPLQPWLPPAGPIHVLVTTRRRDLPQYHPLGLRFLTIAEGRALLDSGQRSHGPDADPLITEVGGLPLALELLRDALDNNPELTPQALLEEFQQAGPVALLEEFAQDYGDQLPSGHEKGVIRTFALSWDLADEPARKVLTTLAGFAPAPVPRDLLREALGLSEVQGWRDPLGQALQRLRKLSLIEFDQDQSPYAHRLILGFIQVAHPDPALREQVQAVIQRHMDQAELEESNETMRHLERVLPHAEALVQAGTLGDQAAISLRNRIALHHQCLGRYVLARGHCEDALRHAERVYPAGHPEIAIRQSNLALVLRDLGELAEARGYYEGALRHAERVYPEGHSDIAIGQSNLALVLKDLGELAEARDLLRLALASDQASFEPGHPTIALRQSNLALVLKNLGERTEARDLLRAALASEQASFEPGHPTIARDQSNLALVLQDLGELTEARDLLRAALAADQASFELGHPAIATSQNNLAGVLKDLGERAEARDLLRAALASDQASFDPGHPRIATRQNNLAAVLKDLGEIDEARQLWEHAHRTFRNRLGPDHRSTRTVQEHLDRLGNRRSS